MRVRHSLGEQLHPSVLRVTKTISFEEAHLVTWHCNDCGWATFRDSSSRYIPLLVHYWEASGDDRWCMASLQQNAPEVYLSYLKCKEYLPSKTQGSSDYIADILVPKATILTEEYRLLLDRIQDQIWNMHLASVLHSPDQISTVRWGKSMWTGLDSEPPELIILYYSAGADVSIHTTGQFPLSICASVRISGS